MANLPATSFLEDQRLGLQAREKGFPKRCPVPSDSWYCVILWACNEASNLGGSILYASVIKSCYVRYLSLKFGMYIARKLSRGFYWYLVLASCLWAIIKNLDQHSAVSTYVQKRHIYWGRRLALASVWAQVGHQLDTSWESVGHQLIEGIKPRSHRKYQTGMKYSTSLKQWKSVSLL